MTNISFSYENTQRFGGLSLIYSTEEYQKLLELCDSVLGVRGKSRGGGYAYSEIINVLYLSILSGSTCIEDINLMRDEFSQHPSMASPSSDTVLKMLDELATPYETITSKGSGQKYRFVRNKLLNDLLLKGTMALGLVGSECDFDYDNQIIATEKQDTCMTYKDVKGYAPGIAFANGHPIYIEGRDGNANVMLDQATTLENIFKSLSSYGVKINRARMDGGSYSKEVVAVVEKYCEHFYIRSKRTPYHTSLVQESKGGWRRTKILTSKGVWRTVEVRSLEETEFINGKTYRVILYRYEDGWGKNGLFQNDPTMHYRYFSILTNDFESKEEDIMSYYNGRGSIERVFDQLNNDFNWSHIPSSDMNQNTVFMILTALLRNFYTWFTEVLSKRTKGLFKKKSRIKAFIFHFVTAPARWIREKSGDVLHFLGLTRIQDRYIKHLLYSG